MNCSMRGFPVLHYFLEFAPIHIHWVGYTIKLSHSLSSASPFVFSLSLPQGLFKWAGSSHQVAKMLELQLQSFQWIFKGLLLSHSVVPTLCDPLDCGHQASLYMDSLGKNTGVDCHFLLQFKGLIGHNSGERLEEEHFLGAFNTFKSVRLQADLYNSQH